MTYYAWFIVFVVVAYFIATDDSVATAFYYLTIIIKNKCLIFQWWLIHNPTTPWAKYSMHRRSMKLAKELMDEYKNK
jgi:hypothetical protein